MSEAGSVEVEICGLNGYLCTATGYEDWTVSQLKDAISKATGILPSMQCLIHDQKQLNASLLLSCLMPDTASPVLPRHVGVTLIKWTLGLEWMEKVKHRPDLLRDAPLDIRASRDVVMAAVKRDGKALEYASPELQADPDVVFAAQEQNGFAFSYAAPELRSSRLFVMQIVTRNGCTLAHASNDLKADPGVVEAAVVQNEYALQYAPRHLREDKHFLLPIVVKNPDLCDVIPYRLRKDSDFERLISMKKLGVHFN